jgi:hypothetical protein
MSDTVGAAFVDVDEWRDLPRRHRYVHGGFEDTHTLFSFCFPPEDEYRGRFFQYLEGGSGGHETLIQTPRWILTMAFEDLGGYLVESNQGHYPNEGMGFANDWELFGASAESALFAKTIAVEMYGHAPHHGYVWGGSGGAPARSTASRTGRMSTTGPVLTSFGAAHLGRCGPRLGCGGSTRTTSLPRSSTRWNPAEVGTRSRP